MSNRHNRILKLIHAVSFGVLAGLGAFFGLGCQSHAELTWGDFTYFSSRDTEKGKVTFDVTKPDGTHIHGTIDAAGDSTAANAAMYQLFRDLAAKIPNGVPAVIP